MIRAENRGRERVKDIVAEMKIGDAFDIGPKLENPQQCIKREFPQRDHYMQIL
jgi:hypothetical protein